MSRCTSDRYRPLWYVELALVYMTLYGRLVEPLEVGKISNNNIIHSFTVGKISIITTSFIHSQYVQSEVGETLRRPEYGEGDSE